MERRPISYHIAGIIMLLLPVFGFGQINCEWATSIENSGFSSAHIDNQDNIIYTGYSIGTSNFTSELVIDAFIVKYDINGNDLWAKSFGGLLNDQISSVFTDNNNNIYVTGFFGSPTIITETTTLVNDSDPSMDFTNDVFIIKYDANGNEQWAKSYGNLEGYISSGDIVVDALGNVYFMGSFTSTVSFGPITLSTYPYPTVHSDIVLLKLDTNGNELWAKRFGHNENETGVAITLDQFDNVYIAGRASCCGDYIEFGPSTINLEAGIFILKYDTNGNEIWGDVMTRALNVSDVEVDNLGDVYVLGTFTSSPNFPLNPLVFGPDSYLGNGQSDIMLLKYDVNGNRMWARSMGSVAEETSDTLIIKNGIMYVSAHSYNYINPYTLNFGFFSLSSIGTTSWMFKYDTDGTEIWGGKIKSTDCVNCGYIDILIDSNDDIFIAGNHYWPMSIGNCDYSSQLGSHGAAYLTKLDGSTLNNEDYQYYETSFIAPNPFSTETTLHSTHTLNNATISIYDVNGKNVFQMNDINGNKILINRNKLPNGIYFLQITEDHKVISNKKIIISD